MSRAVVPVVPESIFGKSREVVPVKSHTTFAVSPGMVASPQTHQPWFIEMDHEMGNLSFYSLVPQKNNANQYVAHYEVESRRPRFIGSVQFTDAWMTTHHRVFLVRDAEIHLSQVFFSPLKADDKLYFDRPPMHRMEVIVPNRFIEDRELLEILQGVFGKGYEIQSLVQRLP
jgi:hypothetical protein